MRSVIIMTLFTLGSCVEDNIADAPSEIEDVSVRLQISSPKADDVVSSRAPDENLINDLYVFVFDGSGNVKSKTYLSGSQLTDGTTGLQPSTTSANNWIKINTTTGDSYIYGIANISGSTNNYTGSVKDQLDAIISLNQLKALSVTLNNDLTRNGNTYLMAGAVNSGNVYKITNTDIKTLVLKRLDSVITFKFKYGSKCTSFVPQSYQVCNVPKKSYMFEKSATRTVAAANSWDASQQSSDFYNSSELTGTLAADMGFTFYLSENRPNGKLAISGNTEKEAYGMREKQTKTSTGSSTRPTVSNGAYVYAPDYGTYVVVKGKYYGKASDNGTDKGIEADVRYVIHLGYAVGGSFNEKANDFFSSRNCKYTYNLTVNGVDDIVVEVVSTSEIENSPGAEGDVTFLDGTTKYLLDAHYETVLLKFSKNLLESGKLKTDFFKYKISTPFTKMGYTDENWIHIIRNSKSGNTYSEQFMPYKSNSGTYLTISQFIDELKKIANGQITNAYDNSNNVVYTCHIDEFYYDNPPSGFTPTAGVPLWKYFVNVPNREAQILNDVSLSPDGNSSVIRSTYVISQRAIQTFYDTDVTNSSLTDAYGVEVYNETGPLQGWDVYNNGNRNSSYTSLNDGRYNFVPIVNSYATKWDVLLSYGNNGYKNSTTTTLNAMNSTYSRAYIACMQRNRDLDGDNTIDADEIKWYLPAINQYVGMFLGDAGLSEESKLYTENQYIYKHFLSSTHKSANLIVYWGEESVSTSAGTEYDMVTKINNQNVNYYRCMRNLGSSTPQNYYVSSSYNITTPYINKKALRSVVSNGELGVHTNWDTESRLPLKGIAIGTGTSTRVVSTIGSAIVYNSNYIVNTPCYYAGSTNGTWRAPNLRELYLMSVSGYLSANDVARTKFKFWNVPIPGSNTSYRIGWFYNGSNLTMGSGLVDEGDHIRCIKDNQ